MRGQTEQDSKGKLEGFKMQGTVKETTSDKLFDFFNYIIMIMTLIIVGYPMYFVIIASFSDPDLVNRGEVLFWPKGFTLLGYQRLFHYPQIVTGYKNTILYTIVGTVVGVFLTLSAGYAISRRDLFGRRFIILMFTFTLFFNGGLIPTYLLVKSLGLLDTFWVMIIPTAVSVFNVIIAKSFYEGSWIDELIEAARIDGCGDLRFFFMIALPLSVPLIAVMTLFYAVGKWNSFFEALIYLKSPEKYPLQLVLRDILISNQVTMGGAMQDVSDITQRLKTAQLVKYSIMIISSLPILVFYPFVQKYFVKGIMLGAIKG